MVFENLSVRHPSSFFLLFLISVLSLSQVPSLYVIKGIIILDNDGNRILAKVGRYYSCFKCEPSFYLNLVL
jgi:hypothetical protein